MGNLLLFGGSATAPAAPNPAAIIGLTYRGTSVQTPGFGCFLELKRGLDEVASVRGQDIVVPWRDGRIVGDRVLDVLTIELQGIVTGDADPAVAVELSTWRSRADALGDLFDPTVVGELVASLEDGSIRTIQARTLTHTWDPLNPMVARVNVVLESVDPDWT